MGHQRNRHASLVRQALARLAGTQSALAIRATRGQTEAAAQRAQQELTRRPQEQASARTVQQTPTRLRGAQLCRAAYAAQDTRLLDRRAHRARQELSRRCRDQPSAANATQTRIHQMGHRHASVVRQTPARLCRGQSALVMRATRGQTEAAAQRVQQEVTRCRQEKASARAVQQTPTRRRGAQLR